MAELFNITNYTFSKASVLDVPATFQTVASTQLLGAVPGIYEIGYSFEVDFNGTKNNPAYFRLGGTYGSATEFSIVAEQNADKKNRYYMFPKDHPGGDILVSLDMRKDAAITLFDCNFVDVMIYRVG